ncbi:MAG: alpha/beta fold hydrolase [Nevskiales bacterium]
MEHFVTRDGCTLPYRLRGKGPLVTLTPGGREPGESVAALAEVLAEHATVLTWDRRNAGAADVFVGGDLPECDLWAEDLADLIAHLGLGPAWIAGGSAGARTSLLCAIRRPEAARGLLLWSASGGPYAAQFLGFNYHVAFIMAAQRGGMAAVCETAWFAERIAANPGNRERLMALDPERFAADMHRWNAAYFYQPGQALTGIANDSLASLRLPTLIFEGNDDVHTAEASRLAASLIPGATLLPPPWTQERWLDHFTGRNGRPVFELYPLVAPAVLDFIARHS